MILRKLLVNWDAGRSPSCSPQPDSPEIHHPGLFLYGAEHVIADTPHTDFGDVCSLSDVFNPVAIAVRDILVR